jgi:hypothetical protein
VVRFQRGRRLRVDAPNEEGDLVVLLAGIVPSLVPVNLDAAGVSPPAARDFAKPSAR